MVSILSLNNRGKIINQVPMSYKRRAVTEGKKLEIKDGWLILLRIIRMTKYKSINYKFK